MIAFNRPPAETVRDIPRFVERENYAGSFGFQWNRFAATQIDREERATGFSAERLLAETAWPDGGLEGFDILEAGSGAGRFTRPLLQRTKANIHSFDMSNAVDANARTNGDIAPHRLRLFQASIYDIPFDDGSFDKVICIGVLQHTPDFEKSVRSLVQKLKPGGELVIDFYEVRNALTKVHAKYLLRPFTRRMDNERLLGLIERNADRLIGSYRWLKNKGLGRFTRFLPVVDIDGTFPKDLDDKALREWVILDTFDMYSPAHDHPQRIRDVAAMVERAGAKVTFAGHVDVNESPAAVVRAVRSGGSPA